ncbi:MAG: hypothetical protein M3213_03415 [Thermoproteota archaeon]|jgi:hypothetical protein|nr:hypothetical protein [Thermoproteota archaeon]
MSEAASPPPSEVKIKLKHRDWEIEVSCVENKIREVIENVLTSIDNISNDQTESNIQINELKAEIESIKKTLNSWMKSLGRDIGSTDIQRKKVQKGGSTCRSLLEKLLLEGYFETERLLGSIHEELSRRGYNYDRTAVSHSLTDMVRESILTRVGSMRNYRYIQKRPLSDVHTPF